MIRSKTILTILLTLAGSLVVLGGILGKLAVGDRLPWKTAEASITIANPDETGAIETDDMSTESFEEQKSFKIAFQQALQIVESTVDGKAYSVERETEDGKPVIEVGISGQEVFVDAESGEIVLTEDIYEQGDAEDIKEVTEALELQPLATITIQEALQAAESSTDGQAHTVELENEEGNLVYEVVIGLQEIYVDAGNGQILYTETVEQDDRSSDSQPRSSIQIP